MNDKQLITLIEKSSCGTLTIILKKIIEENPNIKEQLKELYTDYLLNKFEV